MRHFVILKKSSVWLGIITVGAILAGINAFQGANPAENVMGKPAVIKEFKMITTEFKSKTQDGKVIEAYRWDPGTIVVEKGDHVKLTFYGVNGKFHPFEIKGVGIKGEVRQGRETAVEFVAEKEGIFEIVCEVHADASQNGPMVGYLIVD